MTAPIITAVFAIGYLGLTAWLCRKVTLYAKALSLRGLTYHLSSKIPEGLLTMAIIFLPPLSTTKAALNKQP